MNALLEIEFVQPNPKFLVAFSVHGNEQSRWSLIASTNALSQPVKLADTRHIPGTRVWLVGQPEDALKGILSEMSVSALKDRVGITDTTLTSIRKYLGIQQGIGRGGARPNTGRRNKIGIGMKLID